MHAYDAGPSYSRRSRAASLDYQEEEVVEESIEYQPDDDVNKPSGMHLTTRHTRSHYDLHEKKGGGGRVRGGFMAPTQSSNRGPRVPLQPREMEPPIAPSHAPEHGTHRSAASCFGGGSSSGSGGWGASCSSSRCGGSSCSCLSPGASGTSARRGHQRGTHDKPHTQRDLRVAGGSAIVGASPNVVQNQRSFFQLPASPVRHAMRGGGAAMTPPSPDAMLVPGSPIPGFDAGGLEGSDCGGEDGYQASASMSNLHAEVNEGRGGGGGGGGLSSGMMGREAGLMRRYADTPPDNEVFDPPSSAEHGPEVQDDGGLNMQPSPPILATAVAQAPSSGGIQQGPWYLPPSFNALQPGAHSEVPSGRVSRQCGSRGRMSSVSANDEIEEDIDELDELARNLASRGSVAAEVSQSNSPFPHDAVGTPTRETHPPPPRQPQNQQITDEVGSMQPPIVQRSQSDGSSQHRNRNNQQRISHDGSVASGELPDEYAANDFPWDGPSPSSPEIGNQYNLGRTAPPEVLHSQLGLGNNGSSGFAPAPAGDAVIDHAAGARGSRRGSDAAAAGDFQQYADPRRPSLDQPPPGIERLESLHSQEDAAATRAEQQPSRRSSRSSRHDSSGSNAAAARDAAAAATANAAAEEEAAALAEAEAMVQRLQGLEGDAWSAVEGPLPHGTYSDDPSESEESTSGVHHHHPTRAMMPQRGGPSGMPPPVHTDFSTSLIPELDDASARNEAIQLADTLRSQGAGGSSLRVGAAVSRGPRAAMEDRLQLQPLPAPPDDDRGGSNTSGVSGGGAAAYLAVFDGHNGAGTAHEAKSRLHLHLRRRILAASRARLTSQRQQQGGAVAAAQRARAGVNVQPSLPPAPFSTEGLSTAIEYSFADLDTWLRAHARPISGVPTSAGSRRSGSSDGELLDRMLGRDPAGLGNYPINAPSSAGSNGFVIGAPSEADEAYDDEDLAESTPGGIDESSQSVHESFGNPIGHLAAEQPRAADGTSLAVDPSRAGGSAGGPAEDDGPSVVGGGSTALVCVACGRRLHIAHVGDSRAVLVTAGRPVARLTVDHTPAEPSEAERIVAAGGFISRGRVAGVLAVSRALGDLELQPYISPEPQLGVFTLPEPSEAPSVLILASDGLWAHLEDEEAASIAGAHPEEPQAAADALMAEVARRGGRDNASVIVASWV